MAQDGPVNDLLRIYIICDPSDLESERLTTVTGFLYDQGHECILPSGIEDEREALQEHADNLDICDACIIYFGAASDRWFSAKLRDLRKALCRRTQPLLAKAVYMAPPETPGKKSLRTHEAVVIHDPDIFTAASLQPFLTLLRGKTKQAGGR